MVVSEGDGEIWQFCPGSPMTPVVEPRSWMISDNKAGAGMPGCPTLARAWRVPYLMNSLLVGETKSLDLNLIFEQR